MRLARPAALAVLALALAPAAARADVTDEIIVHHKAGLTATERADVRADSDTVLQERLPLQDTEVVAVTGGTRADALRELQADPDVAWAEPNRILRPLTNDASWSLLWGLHNAGTGGMRIDADLDAAQAWSVSVGTGITVGVVDTGVQANHPDLGGRVVTGLNAMDNSTDTDDVLGHGTHVAGIIAATKDNSVGVVGIAPAAQIEPIKVFPDDDSGATTTDIVKAFNFAGTQGLPIVNASLGGYGYSPTLDAAMSSHPGTLYVIAAGNGDAYGNGTNNDVYPVSPCVSSAANVLCVGATTGQDARTSFSNYGAATVDVFAPGEYIFSTVPGSAYAYMSGTSMATPYVAGVAALVAATDVSLRGSLLAQRIKDTVDKPAALANLAVTGGRVNAARAVGAAVDAPSQGVIAAAVGGTGTATVTMTSRESDIARYKVSVDGSYIGDSTARTFTLNGLAAGVHSITVVAANTSNMDAPASVPATVTVQAPGGATATPVPTRPSTGLPATTTPTTSTKPAPPVSGVQIVRHGSRRRLTFRVTRTSRITVTLLKGRNGRYTRTSSKTVRMAAGLESLPITSRLLGMRVPAGRWRVSVGSGSTAVATVAFVKR